MSASGKSSNRHSEYSRGYHTGTGHGIYAAAGIRDRQRMLERRAVAAARTSTPATRAKAPQASKPAKTPAGPVPVSLLGLGFVAVQVAAGTAAVVRKIRSAR